MSGISSSVRGFVHIFPGSLRPLRTNSPPLLSPPARGTKTSTAKVSSFQGVAMLRTHPRPLPNCCSLLACKTFTQVFPVVVLRRARHGPCSSKSARDGRTPGRPDKVPRARSGGVYPESRRAHGRPLSAGRPGGLVTVTSRSRVTNWSYLPLSRERFYHPKLETLG